MHLTDDDLQIFMEIYSSSFNEEISVTEAREMASRVLLLYEALAQPLPSEQHPLLPSLDNSRDSTVS